MAGNGTAMPSASHQNKGGPSVDLDSPLQHEAPIGGEGRVGLSVKKAGQNEVAARREKLFER